MKFTHDYHFTPNYPGSWLKLYQNYNSLWGFGSNTSGQLGLGDQEDKLSPEQISGSKAELSSDFSRPLVGKARAISTGGYHTVVIDLDDNVWTCGSDKYGQLGLEDQGERLRLEQIPGSKADLRSDFSRPLVGKAKAISAGGSHTVIIATRVL